MKTKKEKRKKNKEAMNKCTRSGPCKFFLTMKSSRSLRAGVQTN